MIRDLNNAESDCTELSPQVCIIGAGTAGIFLAEKLHALKIDVMLLEAGGIFARQPEEFGEIPQHLGIRYRGADFGRSFGLGGTSVLWGGQLISISPADLAARPSVGIDAWPLGFDEIAGYFDSVRSSLGIECPKIERESELIRECFADLADMSSDFVLRLSEWLPFRTRNLAKVFSESLNRPDGISVWLNASVTRMEHTGSTINSITAVSPSGSTLRVRPQVVVICAGALESTRLLLEFDAANDQLLSRKGAPLGRFFSDHLSVTCGRFHCVDWPRFNSGVAPIFTGQIMRTPRLELAAEAQRHLGATSAFAHFTFVTQGQTGFDVVRNVLRRRQGEQLGLNLSFEMLGRVMHDVSAMAYWRFFKQRLYIPRGAELLLQIDIEQTPNPDSRIFLGTESDSKGRKHLVIDWRIKNEDIQIIRDVADRAIQAWQGSKLASLAKLYVTLPETFHNFETLYDVYHPTGSIRMGTYQHNSVLNKDLRVWALSNVYVSSTAAFPSAGSANPGLTHLALTARLADHLKQQILK